MSELSRAVGVAWVFAGALLITCFVALAASCNSVDPRNGPDPPNQNGTGEPTTESNNAAAAIVPSPRGGAPAVWLGRTRKMVLFGGMLPITGDTFEYDADTVAWRRLAPEDRGSVPAPRCHHTLVSEGTDETALMFGGFSFAGRFNDVWRYDATQSVWTELRTTGTRPVKRCLHAAAYITSRNEMFIYGGITDAGVAADDFFDDTHVFSTENNEWTRVSVAGPGKLAGAIAFYSSVDGAVFLWGGRQVTTYPTTLWRFDVDLYTWTAVHTSGDSPIGREDPAYFWDDASGVLTIFSGRNDLTAEVLLEDAYELDAASGEWRRARFSTSPSARWRASIVFDPEAQRGLLFGGWRDFGGRDALNDTWSYDAVSREWERLVITD